jgi:hypothetical protein
MKIYVHNYYTKQLFYKLCHNTTDKEINVSGKLANVKCNYNGITFELIFNPTINDNVDGLHLIDYYSIRQDFQNYSDFNDCGAFDGFVDTSVMGRLCDIIENKSNWLVLIFKTEKIFSKFDEEPNEHMIPFEETIDRLLNHKIITDNILLNDSFSSKYPNVYHTFTNTIFNWNGHNDLKWYYDFKYIFERLNHEYKLGYSIMTSKKHRKVIAEGLNGFKYVTVSQSDKLTNNLIPNVEVNKINGETDFDNVDYIVNLHNGLDMFFKRLPKSKMHILDESHGGKNYEVVFHYLTEKTLGFILAGIPFISTHSYPLDCIHKMVDIEEHPFMERFREHKGNPEMFVEFVREFMWEFDYNYELCKKWSIKCHERFIKKINNENSLFDLIQKI